MTVNTLVLAGLSLMALVIALIAGVDSAFATPCSAAVGCARSAPGPIIGAGLPILAIGFGAYWLVGRFLRRSD
jgi:hypothetical protein